MRPSDLDPDRWRRIDQVFDAALDRPPGERAAYLDEACEGDPELTAAVALGDIDVPISSGEVGGNRLREHAIHRLASGRYDIDYARKVLTRVVRSGSNGHAEYATQMLEHLLRRQAAFFDDVDPRSSPKR